MIKHPAVNYAEKAVEERIRVPKYVKIQCREFIEILCRWFFGTVPQNRQQYPEGNPAILTAS